MGAGIAMATVGGVVTLAGIIMTGVGGWCYDYNEYSSHYDDYYYPYGLEGLILLCVGIPMFLAVGLPLIAMSSWPFIIADKTKFAIDIAKIKTASIFFLIKSLFSRPVWGLFYLLTFTISASCACQKRIARHGGRNDRQLDQAPLHVRWRGGRCLLPRGSRLYDGLPGLGQGYGGLRPYSAHAGRRSLPVGASRLGMLVPPPQSPSG